MSSAANLYTSVINDVVQQVRESFLDEAVDESVLQELKTIWTAKLEASKTVEQPARQDDAGGKAKGKAGAGARARQNLVQQGGAGPSGAGPSGAMHAAAGAVPGQPANPADLVLQMNEIVPVQITVPAQPGNPSSQPRTLTVKVPAHALQKTGNTSQKLQTLLQQAIAQALTLPDSHAAVFLQSQINQAFSLQLPPS